MDNTSNQSPLTTAFSWAVFMDRLLKAGFAVLVFGLVCVILFKVNHIIPNGPMITDGLPIAFAGGAVALVVLTLVGLPIIPAAVAGIASFWLLQHFVHF